MPWTKERLEEVARTRLDGAKLVVVANREPFSHVHDGDEIRCIRPASGLATALDPVLQAWENDDAPLAKYEAGTWGPEEADRLIEADGRRWRRP